MNHLPLPILALALIGAATIAAVAGWVAAREACLNRAAGAVDPTPEQIGAAEARDHMRFLEPDGEW